MADILRQVRRLNGLGDRALAEPFAGGAGASLSLLFLEATPRIVINDADPLIRDFWWTLVRRPGPFLRLLKTTPVSIPEWRRQRAVSRLKSGVSRLRRAFAAFYLNRCNRSGIILDGGPIGGIDQRGKWKVDARYNKTELEARCRKVAEYRDRIGVSGKDGMDFLDSNDPARTFFFIDPPYFEKGATLYLDSLGPDYHKNLAARLSSMRDAAWLLTYDDCSEVRKLYRKWAAIRPFSLRYAAAERRQGRELCITPRWMELPRLQSSLAIRW